MKYEEYNRRKEDEEFCLLGYNTIQFKGRKQTFRRNKSPPSSAAEE
jgi:hypothetical protein